MQINKRNLLNRWCRRLRIRIEFAGAAKDSRVKFEICNLLADHTYGLYSAASVNHVCKTLQSGYVCGTITR